MEINMTIEELKELDHYPNIRITETKEKKTVHKKALHRNYHRSYSFSSYIIMFFFFSFIGWVWEVAIHLLEDGIFVNRGTLFGPWLPIYGVGGTLGIIMLKKMIDNPLLTFFTLIIMCSVIEYSTGWFLETFLHEKYWDYTGYFGNIQGRVCMEGALAFGFAGCGGIYILAPMVDDFLKRFTRKTQAIICSALIVLFVCDMVYSKFNPNVGKGITEYTSCPITGITDETNN